MAKTRPPVIEPKYTRFRHQDRREGLGPTTAWATGLAATVPMPGAMGLAMREQTMCSTTAGSFQRLRRQHLGSWPWRVTFAFVTRDELEVLAPLGPANPRDLKAWADLIAFMLETAVSEGSSLGIESGTAAEFVVAKLAEDLPY